MFDRVAQQKGEWSRASGLFEETLSLATQMKRPLSPNSQEEEEEEEEDSVRHLQGLVFLSHALFLHQSLRRRRRKKQEEEEEEVRAEEVEEAYHQALVFLPWLSPTPRKQALLLSNYALFLLKEEGDEEGAEEAYRRCVMICVVDDL